MASLLSILFEERLCADMIQIGSHTEGLQYRRVGDVDKDAIASWFLQGRNLPFGKKYVTKEPKLSSPRDVLFGDLGIADFDSLTSAEQTDGVDAAIRPATNRRIFHHSEWLHWPGACHPAPW